MIRKSRKGISCRVDPIRSVEEIERIKKLLKDKPRDYCLFVCGINNGLRAGDLLKIKISDVRHLKPGQTFELIEQKTKKPNVFMVNHAVHRAIKAHLADWERKLAAKGQQLDDGERLFGIKSKVRVHQLIQIWAKEAGLKGHFSSHTLRKTFGYMQRTKYGMGFELIAKRFNHSNPAITMQYIGIQDKEVNAMLMNEI